MSIVHCDSCGKQIDSDMDVECFTPILDEVACKSCRDNADELAYERQQQRLMDGDHLEIEVKQNQQLRDAGRGHLVKPI